MDIPDQLVKAIAGGNAVLFVGAGLSRGAGLPGWADLLAPLMDEIKLPEARRQDLLQAAQDYEIARGREALLEHVLRATDTADTEPTAVHRRLPDLGIDAWITTNYDDLLERTLRQADAHQDRATRQVHRVQWVPALSEHETDREA